MASTGFGITITWATSSFTAEITDATLPEQIREAIQTSHTETTDGEKTFIPSDLVDGGELQYEINFDPEESPPMGASAENITVAFASGADWQFSGFMTSYAPTAPLEDRMTASVTVKVSGGITINAAA